MSDKMSSDLRNRIKELEHENAELRAHSELLREENERHFQLYQIEQEWRTKADRKLLDLREELKIYKKYITLDVSAISTSEQALLQEKGE